MFSSAVFVFITCSICWIFFIISDLNSTYSRTTMLSISLFIPERSSENRSLYALENQNDAKNPIIYNCNICYNYLEIDYHYRYNLYIENHYQCGDYVGNQGG